MKIFALGSPWLGGRKWYQHIRFPEGVTNFRYTGERGKLRTALFVEFLESFELKPEDRVLDIGSNAGLFCLRVSSRVQSATGIEFDPGFYKQALFVKKVLSRPDQDYSNVTFIQGSILDHLDLVQSSTILFASKVLYHKNLGSGVNQLLSSVRSSNVHTILLQGHTTQGELGQKGGMTQLMESIGFDLQTVFPHPEYPVAVARRVYNLGSETKIS